MKDRFKFRVWDKGNEQYVDYADMLYIDPSGEITYGCYDGDREDMYYYEQDDVVIEQCTGLKDKNGKLIYEGDIVKRSKQAFIVEWCQDRLSFVLSNDENLFESYDITHFEWEVIGNIHENIELLEQTNE